MANSSFNWEEIAKEASLFNQFISEGQVEDSLLSDTEPSFLLALSPDSPSDVCTQVDLKESMTGQNMKTPLKDSTNMDKTVDNYVSRVVQNNMNVTPQKCVESQESSGPYCPGSAEFEEFMSNVMNMTPLTGDCESARSANSTVISADDENVYIDIKDGCQSENKKQSRSHVRKGTFDLDKPVNGMVVPDVDNSEEKSQKEKVIKESNVTEITGAAAEVVEDGTKIEVIENLEKFLGAELLASPPSLSDVGPAVEDNIEKSFGSFSDVNPVVEDLLGNRKSEIPSDLPECGESKLRLASAAAKVADVFDDLEMDCQDFFDHKETDKVEAKQVSDEECCEYEEELLINFGGCSVKKKKPKNVPCLDNVSTQKIAESECDSVCDQSEEKICDRNSFIVNRMKDSSDTRAHHAKKVVEKGSKKGEGKCQLDCLAGKKDEQLENRLTEIDNGIASDVQKMRRSVSDLSTNAGSKAIPRKSTSGLPMKAPTTKLSLMKPGQIQSKLQLKRSSLGIATVKSQAKGRQDEAVTKVDSLKTGGSNSKAVTKTQQDAPTSRLVPSSSLLQPKPAVQTKDTKLQIKSLGKLSDQSNGKRKISLLPNGPKIIMKAPEQQAVRTQLNEDNSKTATKVFRRPSLKMIRPPSTRTAANKTNANIQSRQASELVPESNTAASLKKSSPPCQVSIPVIDGSKTVTKEPSNQLKKVRGQDQAVALEEGGKTVTKAARKKGPAPVKALIPMAGSRTITKEPSLNGSRTVTKSSSAESFTASTDASLDTPMKSDKFLVPKRLSNVFHSPKKMSENAENGTKKSSFIPTPTRLNRNSSDSSTGSTPGRGFRKPLSLASNGSPFPGSQSGGEDFDAFRPRRALVQNTPEVEPRRQSMWSPVKKYRGISAEDMAFQCTKGVRGDQDNSLI